MSDNDVVAKMIEFVEKKERELQSNKMNADSQAKNDVVKAIMDELERVTSNEDK